MNHICPNKNVSRAKMAFFKWEDNILYGILALKSFIYIYILLLLLLLLLIYISCLVTKKIIIIFQKNQEDYLGS